MDKRLLMLVFFVCMLFLLGAVAFSKAWQKNVMKPLEDIQLKASPSRSANQ